MYVRSHTDIFRFILLYFIIASYVPQGGKITPWFETVSPAKAAKEEVLVEPEDDTEVEDNTYVGESRSVITR